jgi:hypothetical protein
MAQARKAPAGSVAEVAGGTEGRGWDERPGPDGHQVDPSDRTRPGQVSDGQPEQGGQESD